MIEQLQRWWNRGRQQQTPRDLSPADGTAEPTYGNMALVLVSRSYQKTAGGHDCECFGGLDSRIDEPCWGQVDTVYTEAGLAGYYCQGHRDLPDPETSTTYSPEPPPAPTPEERAAAYDAKVAEYHASGQYAAEMKRIGVLEKVESTPEDCRCNRIVAANQPLPPPLPRSRITEHFENCPAHLRIMADQVTVSCGCADCLCVSPITGHLESCPVHKRILADYPSGPPVVSVVSPAVRPEDEPEDHTTTNWLWTDGAATWRFEPWPGATERIEISVPVGWSLVCHAERGVMLRNVFGIVAQAIEVGVRAKHRVDGFRVHGNPENA